MASQEPRGETAAGHGGAPPRRRTGAWATVGVLLAVGIVVPLLVFIYDSEKPTLWGFPFYYWFQFALIPVVSVLTYIAFRISERATAQERRAHGLGPSAGKKGGVQ
jgi:CBS domain containing-hemolysin-like protein